MKRIGLIITSLILFAVSLYIAYGQAVDYSGLKPVAGGHLVSPVPFSFGQSGGFIANYSQAFSDLVNSLLPVLGQNLLLVLILLALIVELVLLYPSVLIQLKQKKIHLFHKKLVDRFAKGELSVSKTNHELNILYAVNERLHARGALLFLAQLILFSAVLLGLVSLNATPQLLSGQFSAFNLALLNQPVSFYVPLLTALAFLLHSLTKIHLRQREDYIAGAQVVIALIIAVIASTAIFYISGIMATLLSVYFITLITFSTMRYIVVEDNARAWGKKAQRDLIHLLRTTRIHKNKLEYASRRFNHLPVIRHMNFHLLEEAASMSLMLTIALQVFASTL